MSLFGNKLFALLHRLRKYQDRLYICNWVYTSQSYCILCSGKKEKILTISAKEFLTFLNNKSKYVSTPVSSNVHLPSDHIILLLNMLEMNRTHIWNEFTQMSYAIHFNMNQSSVYTAVVLPKSTFQLSIFYFYVDFISDLSIRSYWTCQYGHFLCWRQRNLSNLRMRAPIPSEILTKLHI